MSNVFHFMEEKLSGSSGSHDANPTTSLPATYKAVVVESAGGKPTIKDLPLQHPSRGNILIKTIACGVCASDNGAIAGAFHNPFPLVPGHEIIGKVVAVGEGEDNWKIGDIVGSGWFGGCCGDCKPCQHNMKQCCVKGMINGVTKDGGYAEYVTIRREAAVKVPEGADPVEYAPLLCAGITVFNSMRKLNLRPGSVVGVQGLGGLGHLALQFASKLSYNVVALSSSSAKESEARSLGARHYIDSSSTDPISTLQSLGGADCIVVTGGSTEVVSNLVNGLAPGGTLLVLSPMDLKLNSASLIMGGRRIVGWPSGSSIDSEETMQFAKDNGVKCMVEGFKWTEFEKALEHMNSGKVRFRGVLTF